MKKLTFILLFLITMALGIGLRLHVAHLSPYYIDCDTATVGLMAKHILEGNIPMFFYGQEYLGPLEAFVMAGSFKIFGMSTYSMFYGQIFLSILFLFSTYLLAKELTNRWAALLAMLYCSLAPFYLIVHNLLPYGYHVELLLMGNFLFVLTYRIIRTDILSRKILYYILLGFIAGLGFWTQYLIAYYLIPVALFLAINERWKNLFKYGSLTAIFFFLGGLPFWIYTVIHRFGTFGFPPSDKAGFLPAIKKFFAMDCMRLLGIRIPIFAPNNWLHTVVVCIYIYVFSYFLLTTFFNKPERGFRINKNYLILFFALSLIIFYGSFNFFSVRGCAYYALPVFSIIPVALASMFNNLGRKKIFVSSLVFLSVFSFSINDIYHGLRGEKASLRSREEYWSGYIKFLRDKGINRVLGGNAYDFVTCFLTEEEVIASAYSGSEYKPHAEAVEYADNVALVNIGFGFKENIEMLCKNYKSDFELFYNLIPYPYNIKNILPVQWNASSNYYSKEANRAFDRHIDCWWSTKTPKKMGMYFGVDLGRLHTVCRLVVFNAEHTRNLPESCKVEVSKDGKEWDEVLYVKAPEPLFWSGPRLYWHRIHGRWELIFKPVAARYIRLTQIGDDYLNPWEINEMFIYEFLGYREKQEKKKYFARNAKKILEFAKSKSIDFIYADFWLSNKINRWSEGKIGVLSPFYRCFPNDGIQDRRVKLSPDTMFVINQEDENEFLNIINRFNLCMDRRVFGSFVCWCFDKWKGTYLEVLEDERWLFWDGLGVAARDLENYSKLLMRYAGLLETKGDYENALSYYEESLKNYPNNTAAHLKWLRLLKRLKLTEQYKKQHKFYRYKFVPRTKKAVLFKNGAEFAGYSINKNKLRIGEEFRLDLYWKVKHDISLDMIVFVHFSKEAKPVFQADHPFLYRYLRPLEPLDGEIYKETSIIKVPNDAQPGVYEIIIGFWIPETKERIPVEGQKRKKKIVLGKVEVESRKF